MLTSSGRVPLRLAMAEHPGNDHVDGAWWPQSRTLAVELVDLVDHFPAPYGRIVRAFVSRADWDAAPGYVDAAAGAVRVGPSPRRDSHLVHLETAERSVLHVLVVPPGFTDAQGAESMLAAATAGNRHSAADILEAVTEYPDVDPSDRWTDHGGSWWDPDPLAPSFRPGTGQGQGQDT
ncbi:DUF5994 family protein [Pimelobacter simplex]|uniref:DUF5994 family protein n=1 Tax=Nocardioides simplex TaxID=2045 RepID=UPI003AAD9E2B